MKKTLFFLMFLPLLTISIATLAKAKEPSFSRYQFYMHEIFQKYRNTHLAIMSGRYDVADIHLRHMLQDIDDVSNNVPEKKSDGKRLGRAQISRHLSKLKNTAGAMRKALEKENPREIVRLSNDVMNTCADCHVTERLKFLFRLKRKEGLFENYMHQVSDNYALAEIYLESGEPNQAADYLTMTAHLLSILRNVFPDEGPSGVIMDRTRFSKEIRKVEGLNEMAQEDIRKNRGVDFVTLKKELNFICVACHEPEKVK